MDDVDNKKLAERDISKCIKGDIHVFTLEQSRAPYMYLENVELAQQFKGLSRGDFVFSPKDAVWEAFLEHLLDNGYVATHFSVNETTEAFKFFTREFKKYWEV